MTPGRRGWIVLALVAASALATCARPTADDEAHMIVRYVRNERGGLVFDADRQVIVDEVVHGRVEIEISDALVL